MRVLGSLMGIVAAAGGGAWGAAAIVHLAGLTGIPAALAGVVLAMVMATLLFAAGVLLAQLLGPRR